MGARWQAWATVCVALLFSTPIWAGETFVGAFAEPADGGNLDTVRSSYDGNTVLIVPRTHASEALNGGTRWRNVLFAIRGMAGKTPVFRLPLTSPGTGWSILAQDAVSFQNVKLVWSYEPKAGNWNSFGAYTRTGATPAAWTVEARNAAPFTQDVVYVSINEHFPVADFYEWIEGEVLVHPLVEPTPSEAKPGTFIIGYQSGAAASAACSRSIPDQPLFGFVIRDPAENPRQLVVLVSGQHPYEGQNKIALQAAVDWILKSTSAEARAYRAQYVTVVYPFVNPTGELAGLWRGTAYAPGKDTNRNWHTTETVPSRDRGIDTVIVHKNALQKDIATLGLGEPHAVLDYHQNYGDYPEHLDYVLHSSPSNASHAPVARRVSATSFAAYFERLSARAGIASHPSDPFSQETLRGYLIGRGVALPLTFERSVYNTFTSECAFGVATVSALVDPAMIASNDPAARLVGAPFSGNENSAVRLDDSLTLAAAIRSLNIDPIKFDANAITTAPSRRVTALADAEAAFTSNFAIEPMELIARSHAALEHVHFALTSVNSSVRPSAERRTTDLLAGSGVYAVGSDHTRSATLPGASAVADVEGATVAVAAATFDQAAAQ